MKRTAAGRSLGAPKTPSSRRTVELLPAARALLLTHRRSQNQRRLLLGEEWKERDLVFTDALGAAVSPDNVRRLFRSFMADAGLPKIPFRNLRHSFATLHLSTGEPTKVVSEALGHTRTSITEDLYRRVDRTHQRKAAASLAALLDAASDDVAGTVAGGEGLMA